MGQSTFLDRVGSSQRQGRGGDLEHRNDGSLRSDPRGLESVLAQAGRQGDRSGSSAKNRRARGPICFGYPGQRRDADGPAAGGYARACQMRSRFHFGLLLLGSALFAHAADSKSACDRECLRGFVTQYLNALVAHKPADLPLASNVRFTEDTVEMKLGASPLWTNAARLRPYRLDILDTRQGVAAAQAIVEESGAPVMLMLRLKISGGKIAEVETQVTRNKTEGSLFNIDALKAPSGAMLWVPSDSQRNARAEAVRIA